MDIQTIQGNSVSRLGLAGQQPMESGCVDLAWQAGVNYFFSYGVGDNPIINDLKPLLQQHRESVIVATGSEKRELNHWREYLEQVQQTLDISTIDILFAEYVSPADDWQQVKALADQLYRWKSEGVIRYVGITTHNRAIAQQLNQESLCDVLMHRYNMAHRKAEETVLPMAEAAKIPVVAFTSTRWGTLLQKPTDWPTAPPTALDCYRFGLSQPAIQLVLTAPKTRKELEANLAVLKSPPMSEQEAVHWRQFGDLVYGNGQDSFETTWP
ncbi:aldo/keto reductase [Nodosilinea sp. LEGE 07088]|uniref:aldo/keto reductase n=1 Tax=Nodosilinea sp. LEGE 07088 TaxID=2777968 RepID=UPI00187F2023|nr:aldo/keto reductase [Nodosilinea sp. LEGE 07088]MBE9138034.1 aldo/keto reductase [Nodosilinea sp. LEGE 07088]